MPTYELTADTDTDAVLDSDEVVTDVVYVGDTKHLRTEQDAQTHAQTQLEAMTRTELYQYGQDHDVDLNWRGANADSAAEMRQKIQDHQDGGDE